MKKLLVLALAAMMLVGCKQEEPEPKETNEKVVRDSKEDEPKKESKYEHEELDAYEEVLSDHLKDNKDGFAAALINIDDDDYYELAMFNGDTEADGAYLYTYKDGKAIDMATDGFPFYGSYGYMNYVPKSGYFSYDYDGNGGDTNGDFMFFAFNLKDGKVENLCSLERVFYYDDSRADVFSNHNKEISESEYNELYQKYWYDYNGDDLEDLYYEGCSKLTSEDDIEAFLAENDVDEVEVSYTDEDIKAMSPAELFDAFCNGDVEGEYIDENGDSHPYTLDGFEIGGYDANDSLSIGEPVDVDNDGELEYELISPMYGSMFFDCKDGRVVLIAEGEGTAAMCSYTTYDGATWIVHSDTTHMGRCMYFLDKYNGDLQIVDSINLYWETEDYEEDSPKTYYFNDQEITEQEYNSYYQAIFE